jgi:hypothetical protein
MNEQEEATRAQEFETDENATYDFIETAIADICRQTITVATLVEGCEHFCTHCVKMFAESGDKCQQECLRYGATYCEWFRCPMCYIDWPRNKVCSKTDFITKNWGCACTFGDYSRHLQLIDEEGRLEQNGNLPNWR